MPLAKDGWIQLFQEVDDNGNPSNGGLINRSSFATGQKNVAAAGTGEQVSASQVIPNGFSVLIKAKFTNSGVIRVGNSKANSESASSSFTLRANEAIRMFITNLNLVWIDATVSGEGVEWATET
jgi:hypothetical protein